VNRWSAGLALAALVMSTSAAVATSSEAAAGCAKWRMHTVKSGLGILESLLPDDHGGMLLSSSSHDAVERLSRAGKITTIAAADSPGQLVRHGKRVFVPTGDGAQSGALGRDDGTLRLLNLRTGALSPYADHLTMPNGLALGRHGNAFVTRDIGAGTGITRIAAKHHHKVTTQWAKLNDTNGIAIDRHRRIMYVDRTFTEKSPVIAIPMRHPGRAKRIGSLTALGSAVPKGLDDLIRAPDGVLYLPGNSSGEVFSFDPKDRRACLIANGLQNPSAIAVGTGHGWRKGALFVCGFDGTVRELDPPS
jgi:hypothetical protein